MSAKKRQNAKPISLYGISPEDALRRALNTPLPNREEPESVKKDSPKPKTAPKKPKPKK
jgi:hypothetical protein